MTPVFSQRDKRNSRFINAVFVAKGFVGNVALSVPAANFRNLSLGQFRAAVPFLASHIQNVIGLSTNKEMIRIYTARIVARMANTHTFGDRAVMQLVTVAMHKLLVAIDGHFAIPIRVAVSSPFPTAAWRIYVDFAPKAVYARVLDAVSVYKANRLASNPSISRTTLIGNRCKLPATAMAVTVWDFVRGIIEGHSDLHSRCVKSRDIDVSPAQRIGFYISIIPQNGGAF